MNGNAPPSTTSATSTTSPWKILAALAAVVVFGLGAALVGGFFWLQSHSEELAVQGKAALRAGHEFGRGKEAPACVDEALGRLGGSPGIVAEATNKVWLAACLKSARVPAGYCDDVPPRNEIMRSATWALERCAELGREDQPCTRLVGAIQERCLAAPDPAAPSDAAESANGGAASGAAASSGATPDAPDTTGP